MKKLNVFISRITLSFTVAVVFSACFNLAGGSFVCDCRFILEMLGLALCFGLIDTLINRIEFHSKPVYICIEFSLMYTCFLVFALLGHWFGLTIENILLFSFVFLLFYILLHFYDYAGLQAKAREINGELGKRN